MNRIKRVGALAAALGCAFAAAPAAAQERSPGAYVGIDIALLSTTLEYETNLPGTHQEPYGTGHLRLRAGYRITSMFALEAQAIGRRDDSLTDRAGVPATMTTGPIGGLYGRIDLPIGQYAGMYALAGIASVRTEYRSAPNLPFDEDKRRSLSFGAGLEVIITPHLRGSVDLMVYRAGEAKFPRYFAENPDITVAGLGFGLNYSF